MLWAVMLDCPEIPPTTPTATLETAADPPTVKAAASFEFANKLHPLRATFALPCAVTAPLAVGSSARVQPLPPVGTATARAEIVTGCESQRAENSLACTC